MKVIDYNKFLLFDGAMGTMLQNAGLRAREIPEIYNITHPDIIRNIHKMYIEAGSDIVTTNTFGANKLKLKKFNYSVEEIVKAAVTIAKEAAVDKLVALDLGPTGVLMEPMGNYTFDEIYDLFAEQIKSGVAAGADIILIETMSDIYEAKVAILAAKENSTLPIFCTMTFGSSGRTLTGADPLTMVSVLEPLGIDAIGLNCSLGPKELLPIVEEILKYATIPVMVQPNAGLPRIEGANVIYDITPYEFKKYVQILAEKGVTIFGGCCGTNPSYIKALAEVLETIKPLKTNVSKFIAVCTSRRTIKYNENTIMGQNINPKDNQKIKKALEEKDMDYIVSDAMDQVDDGIEIISLNTACHTLDERLLMLSAIREVQGMVNVPLQIDSMDPRVIENAARISSGKPLINICEYDKDIFTEILKCSKKYGNCVKVVISNKNGALESSKEREKARNEIMQVVSESEIPQYNIILEYAH